MKFHISLLAIFILAVSVFGQKRKFTTRPTFSDIPFNLKLEKLPFNYLGHDASRVFDLLAVLKEESVCGKYERSEDCQKRATDLYAGQLWKGVSVADTLAFSFKIDDCDYSADDEVMRCPEFKSDLQGFGGQYTWSHKLINSYRYIGQNAFGVKKSILYQKFENIHINYGENGEPSFTLKNISPETARSLIPKLRILLVGSLISPWTKREAALYEPTMNDPNKSEGDNKTFFIKLKSIMLYDFETGKIYKRTS